MSLFPLSADSMNCTYSVVIRHGLTMTIIVASIQTKTRQQLKIGERISSGLDPANDSGGVGCLTTQANPLTFRQSGNTSGYKHPAVADLKFSPEDDLLDGHALYSPLCCSSPWALVQATSGSHVLFFVAFLRSSWAAAGIKEIMSCISFSVLPLLPTCLNIQPLPKLHLYGRPSG